MAADLPLTCLLCHLDEHFSCLGRIPYFSQEGDARCFHSILGFQAQMESEAIDRSHVRLLCLNASKPLRERDQRISVVSIHVSDDLVFLRN